MGGVETTILQIERAARAGGGGLWPRGVRRAAVAVIFRQGGAGLEVLLIRRAEAKGDRWSGHMAFPGGKVDPGDADARAAAARETGEEIGLSLDRSGVFLGRLSTVWTLRPRGVAPMMVIPCVFALVESAPLGLGVEVQEVVWIPWSFFEDASRREIYERPVAGVPVRFGCYRYEGRLIWGLTYQMIEGLCGRLRP